MCVLQTCPCFLMCILFYYSFIWLHVYAFAITSMVHCGSAFEPGASGLPYYCTSICVRSCCNWRASCVDSKPKKRKKTDSQWNPVYNAFHRICSCGNETIRQQFCKRDLDAANLRPALGHGCGKQTRALGNYFPERICYMFRIPKCRGD